MLKEPTNFTVVWDALKRGLQFAAIGAAVGAAITGLFTLGPSGSQGVLNFFGELAMGSAVGTGAILGAGIGGLIGVPLGGMEGAKEVRNYYEQVAMPAARSDGIQTGAQLEHAATEHEQESRKYRDMIAAQARGGHSLHT